MPTSGNFDVTVYAKVGAVASSSRPQPARTNGRDDIYKKPATPIETPSLPPSKTKKGPYNPYAGIIEDNLSSRNRRVSGQRQIGTTSTSATVNEPPAKKRKLNQNSKSHARSNSLEEIIGSVGQSSVLQAETIDVDASDEDDPISQFPSDDKRPLTPTEATSSHIRLKKKPFEEHGVESTVGTSSSRSPGIKAVLKVLDAAPRVHERIRSWEERTSKTNATDGKEETEEPEKEVGPIPFLNLPHRDFKQPVTKMMKMKKRGGDGEDRALTAAGKQAGHSGGSPNQAVQKSQAGPSTTKGPSVPVHHLGKAPPKSREPRGLPIDFWYCGCERRNKDCGASLWWEDRQLVIKDRDGDVVEKIHYKSIERIEIGNGNPPLILKLDPKSREAVKLESEAYNPKASGPTGEINFEFMRKQCDGWDGPTFSNLVRGLQELNVRCIKLDVPTGKARMEMAQREARIVESGGISDDYKASKSPITTKTFYEPTSTPTKGKGGVKKPNPAMGRPIFNNEAKTPRGKRARSSASPPPTAFPMTTRRVTRYSAPVPQSPSRPIVNPDEIILVYPPSGTGALNITNGDLARLNPDEFLNDTLIEFALKLWLNTLREQNPALAEQVHVFNSFFYKKLAVKTHADGYRSVKKWTSKFDLFQKKYVIVPINEHLHWYLAIIFNPGLVFASREAPPPPQTRNARRKSSSSETISNHGFNEVPPVVFGAAMQSRMDAGDSVTDSTDVDQRDDMSLDQLSSRQSNRLASEVDDLEMVPDSDEDRREVEDNIRSLSLEQSSVQAPSREKTPALAYPDSPMDVDRTTPFKVDFVDKTDPGSPLSRNLPTLELKEDGQSDVGTNGQEVSDEADLILAATENSEDVIGSKLEIFVFDSLGSKHPAAVNHLSKYLVSEAEDKKSKQLPIPDKVGRQVKAPRQPNHCDCGIYLLHFVETVMKDPDAFLQLYATKGFDGEHSFWDQPTLDNRRLGLHDKIVELSTAWKRAKGESVPVGKDSQLDAGPPKAVDEASASQDVQELGEVSNAQPDNVDESDEPVIIGESTKRPARRLR